MKRGIVIGDTEKLWITLKASVSPETAARVLLSFLNNPYAQEMSGRYTKGTNKIVARYEYTGLIDNSVIAEMDEISLRAASGAAPKTEEPRMIGGDYILSRDTHYSWAAREVSRGTSWFSVTKTDRGFAFRYIPAPQRKKSSQRYEGL